MQTRRIRIRIRPGMTGKMQEWLDASFHARRDEALESMRHNGLVWECAYIERGEPDDHVVLIQSAPDLASTSARFLASDLPIDHEAQAALKEIGEAFDVAEVSGYLIQRF